jgi:hypothetical protein
VAGRIEFGGTATVVAQTPSFVDAPPEVEKRGAGPDDVNLLDAIEADVSNPDVAVGRVDGEAPRIPESVSDHFRWIRPGRIEAE